MKKLSKQGKGIGALHHKGRLWIMMTLFLLHLIPVYGLLHLSPFNPKQAPVVQFFPLDPEHYFVEETTHLSLQPLGDEDYQIRLDTTSKTNEKAYLRQDLSLLYQDGILIGKLAQWKEHTDLLEQSLSKKASGSHRFDAISFHHAEFHRDEPAITSQQANSATTLYVIATPPSSPHAFQHATTPEEQSWKIRLDRKLQQEFNQQLRRAVRALQLPGDEYIVIPLTALSTESKQPLPGLTTAQSMEVIGRLWEGLYHYLVIGTKEEGAAPTYGSTIPLILLHQSGSHLLVIYETADGKLHQLRQTIPAA